TAVHLVEEPVEIVVRSSRFAGDGEEIIRLRMTILPAREVGGEDPLQRRPSEPALHRVEPQRRLVVGDAAAGRWEVTERRRRLRAAARVAAIAGQAVALGLAAERDVTEDPRHEAAEIAQREKIRLVHLRDGPRRREGVEPLVHPRVLELIVADDAVPELMAGF